MTDRSQPEPRASGRPESETAQVTKYGLRLYVAGNTSKSAHAILNLKQICEQLLSGRYQLEIIDVYQQPGRARNEQIIATPTLVKFHPAPFRKLVGDLTRGERILSGLGLSEAGA